MTLLMFLLHFDVLCDLLLYRPMEVRNLFVIYDKEKKKKQNIVDGDVI